jgi:ureidoglycolate hydrolase
MMKIQTLEKKTFAEFGEILSMDDVPSVDTANEFDFHDTAQGIKLASRCCTGVLSCRHRPRKVVKMERHHESSEVIVALDGDIVMMMAPSDDELENNTRIRAFMIKQGQAIVMKPNTWHWIPFPVDKHDVHALVLFKDETGANDLHFRDLTVPIVLD